MVTKIAEDAKLGKRLVRAHPMLEAEVVYAARQEYCETAEDFIARRTRLAFLDVDACRLALPRVRIPAPQNSAAACLCDRWSGIAMEHESAPSPLPLVGSMWIALFSCLQYHAFSKSEAPEALNLKPAESETWQILSARAVYSQHL